MGKTAYFLDFEFDTANATFFPRPETELLVEKAIELLSKELPSNILDIGTGCGNIAISLTKYIPSSRMVALDISDTALSVARENAKKYGVEDRIVFIKSNLFENTGKHYENFFDLVISNPPYVAFEDFSSLPIEVRNDPYIALYGGTDGLSFYRRVISEVGCYLKKDGIILMEIGYNQVPYIKQLLEKSDSFYNIECYRDHNDIDRIIKANVTKHTLYEM